MKEKISSDHVFQLRQIIGSWIKEFRKKKRLTQLRLAEELGITEATVSKMEAGKWLSLEMLIKLSITLDFYIFLCEKDSNNDLATVMRHRFEIAQNEKKPIN